MMWKKNYSKVYAGIRKEDVWQKWVDVNNWPTWDSGLEYCQFEGSFSVDNQFILKPKGGPKVKIILSEVTPNRSFADYCKFLGARMYDEHYLEETDEGVRITNVISVTGPLAFLWTFLVAKNVANDVPKQTDALVRSIKSPQER